VTTRRYTDVKRNLEPSTPYKVANDGASNKYVC